jgi:DNA polymerase III delta prime subunit
MIKISPCEDTVEPEAVNVKTILEGCSELSDIYLQKGDMRKVISVYDHALKIYKAYSDISSFHDIKRITKNSCQAALSLENLPALKKHVISRFNIDLDFVLTELGIN